MDEEESITSNIDLEEEEESGPEMSSDEKAMRQFLDELKKYRKKVKKKAKEAKQLKTVRANKKRSEANSANISKSPSSNEISQMKKKKRKRHKLFDPHPPPKDVPADDIKDDSPKKVLTRKEYKDLMKRLYTNNVQNSGKQNNNSQTKNTNQKNKNPEKQSKNSPSKNVNQPKTAEIFTKLYDKSIEAEQKKKEMKEAQNKNEEKNLKLWTKPKTCRQSKVYAHNRVEQYVNYAFDNNKICSEKKLLNILFMLGLAENKRKIKSIAEISDDPNYNNNNSFDNEEEEYSETQEKQKQNSQINVQPEEKVSKNLKDIFGNGMVCKVDELLNVLQKLDYIQITKETENKLEFTEEQNNSQNEEEESESDSGNKTMYEISNLKKFYLEVAKDQISTQFHSIAKEKLLIAMANEKKTPKLEYDPNKQFTTALVLTRETLDHLVAPKQQKPPEELNKNNEEKVQPIKLSEGSKKILDESTRKVEDDQLLCSLPIDQREKHLIKMKNEKIEKMKQDFHSQSTKIERYATPIQFDENTQQMLEKYKEEKKNRVEEKPTYRPSITKYEDYLKMQEELNSSEVKNPQGWDKDISRHRKAYDNFIHFKRLKSEGIDYLLECRINARAQQKEANQNQKSNNNANKKVEKKNKESKKNLNQNVPSERVSFHFQNNESDNADMED